MFGSNGIDYSQHQIAHPVATLLTSADDHRPLARPFPRRMISRVSRPERDLPSFAKSRHAQG